MISAIDLETPERGLHLETRETDEKPAKKKPVKASADADVLREELAALRGRLEAARTMEPKLLHRVHNCRTCFRQARDATIRAIEGT
jgi:hypothetical protein